MSSRIKTYGTVSADKQKEMSGLEFVQGLVDGTLPLNTIAQTLGYDVTQAVNGRVVVTAEPNDAHLNPAGTVHGGLAATLLDSCMGLAVQTTLEKGVAQTTVEFKITLVRPITPETGLIEAEGVVLSRGRRIGTAEERITDQQGRLLAHGTTTCLILQSKIYFDPTTPVRVPRCVMPLQNRVNPFGELTATPERGLFFGNRGGRFHTDARTLTARRWASRQWICCVLDFKGRRRDLWGRFYTELFFLDEPIALAAAHRPCFECRRKDAEAFAEAWRKARRLPTRPYADEMDGVLHDERPQGRAKRLHRRKIDTLPDGAFVALEGEAFAVRDDALLRWTPQGYDVRKPRPRGLSVDVLTPPAILAALSEGYWPHWHPSAET